jgi:hypothetical protein
VDRLPEQTISSYLPFSNCIVGRHIAMLEGPFGRFGYVSFVPAKIVRGVSKEWRRVAAGYSANFVILAGNPLTDTASTKTINAVVLKGKLFDRAQLDQMLNDTKAVDPAVAAH